MQSTQNIINVPLHNLQLSPKNSRKHRSAAHIAATLDSLLAHGQLQNLVVTPSDAAEKYLVDAGGTRLLALQLGVERGQVAADHPVRCLEVTEEMALEASTAENTIREAMHPADQFRAFRNMVEAGKSTAEVAANFAVAESVVAQRLKLANVAQELFNLYEQGDMNLEQLQALALTDDHAAQMRAWFGTKGAAVEHEWQRNSRELRKRITASEIPNSNALARLVGPESYEGAGGILRRDMFSSDVFYADATLLESLAMVKVQEKAEQVRAEGWAWVEPHLEMDYSDLSQYGSRGVPTHREPSTDQKARLLEISSRKKQIEDLLYPDNEGDELPDDECAVLHEEDDQLDAERDAIQESTATYSKEVLSSSGAIIYVSYNGTIEVSRARLQPGQRSSIKGTQQANRDKPAKAELSADMRQRLEAHRAAAVRLHVAANPDIAVTLLIVSLIKNVLSTGEPPVSRDFNITASNEHRGGDPLDKFTDLTASATRKALDDRVKGWCKRIPGKSGDIYAFVDKLPADQRTELLALLTACTLRTGSINGNSSATALHAQFGFNMADHWQPNAPSYITLVKKGLLADAVAEVAGKPAGEAVAAMKKDAAMAEAAKRLAGTGWLPKPLRGKGYALKGGDATAPKTAAPAKKAPAKPAGKAPSKGNATPAKTTAAKKTAPKKQAAKKGAAK